ncbi:MAG: hypothetical protein IPK26_10750 [Planctomycetes bacterium]|nr:hypothetical protein [Planctomycetota bacterium]
MSLRCGAVFLFVFAPATIAQTTHVVGPGGFQQIQNAIAVAAPGDIILVPPGNWYGFTTSIGVTVRGMGAGVIVNGVTATLQPGQTLHLIDLEIWPTTGVTISGGGADLDRCTIDTCTVSSSDVSLQSCVVNGYTFFGLGKQALDATNASLTAIDSEFTGGRGNAQAGWSSSHGIRLQGSVLRGSRLVVRGGEGQGSSSIGPKPALLATNSAVWISDSTLIGGAVPGGPPTACPVVVQGAVSGRLTRSSLTPNCASSFPTSGPLLGMHRPSPLQSPGPFTLEFQTEPNALVGVYFAAGLGRLSIPGIEQAILLDAATASPLDILVADTAGAVVGTWNVPAGFGNAKLWLQAIGTAAPGFLLQASPVGGGVVR